MRPLTRAAIERTRNDRGLTLVELMVVLLVLSLVSGAVFSLLFSSFSSYWRGDVQTQVQQGARVSIDRMTRDLRQARRLINGTTETVGATSVTFNTSCTTPQVSIALPHVATVTLSDSSTVYATDANSSGTLPYDGWYVSYYLAAASNSATPNTAGPYLIRASYDLVGNTLTLATVAANVTALSLNPGGTCPGTATREFTVQLTASQTQSSQNVSSTTVVTSDVTLRNQ